MCGMNYVARAFLNGPILFFLSLPVQKGMSYRETNKNKASEKEHEQPGIKYKE